MASAVTSRPPCRSKAPLRCGPSQRCFDFDFSAAPGSSRGRITNGLYLGEVHGLVSTGTSFSALYVRTRATPTDSTEVVFANVADGSLR